MYQRQSQRKPNRSPEPTFKPDISKKSQIIISDKLHRQGFAPIQAYDGSMSASNHHNQSRSQSRSKEQKSFYERQMYHQKKKEMIIQDEQMKKAEQELDGCTFQPA